MCVKIIAKRKIQRDVANNLAQAKKEQLKLSLQLNLMHTQSLCLSPDKIAFHAQQMSLLQSKLSAVTTCINTLEETAHILENGDFLAQVKSVTQTVVAETRHRLNAINSAQTFDIILEDIEDTQRSINAVASRMGGLASSSLESSLPLLRPVPHFEPLPKPGLLTAPVLGEQGATDASPPRTSHLQTAA